MICNGCQTEKEDFVVWVIPAKTKALQRFCSDCRKPRGGLLDVYFKGEYVDENLRSWDYPDNSPITSRADKQRRMKACNVREAGDRIHGATSFDPISHRHAAESLRR